VPNGTRVTSADWLAIHVFYAGNRRPMLTDCIGPLVDGLRGDGLVSRYFFVNYWLEGPHVRLRLRPSSPAVTGEVRRRTETTIARFLRERPALYDVSAESYAALFNQMFAVEFSEDERALYVDAAGLARMESNNSFKYVRYEPEFGRYGGVAGVDLAEWHFERSSDVTIQATRVANLHLRRVSLGLSAQLMMIMTTAFLADEPATTDFLEAYARYWRRTFHGIVDVPMAIQDKAYEAMGDRLNRRFHEIRAACLHNSRSLPGMLAAWWEHCVDLRGRVVDLAAAGSLRLRDWNGGDRIVTADAEVLPRLLMPYLHMTNNRLGLTVADEAYLGYVLSRALREPGRDAPP
jgi:hypothetical protein